MSYSTNRPLSLSLEYEYIMLSHKYTAVGSCMRKIESLSVKNILGGGMGTRYMEQAFERNPRDCFIYGIVVAGFGFGEVDFCLRVAGRTSDVSRFPPSTEPKRYFYLVFHHAVHPILSGYHPAVCPLDLK